MDQNVVGDFKLQKQKVSTVKLIRRYLLNYGTNDTYLLKGSFECNGYGV